MPAARCTGLSRPAGCLPRPTDSYRAANKLTVSRGSLPRDVQACRALRKLAGCSGVSPHGKRAPLAPTDACRSIHKPALFRGCVPRPADSYRGINKPAVPCGRFPGDFQACRVTRSTRWAGWSGALSPSYPAAFLINAVTSFFSFWWSALRIYIMCPAW